MDKSCKKRFIKDHDYSILAHEQGGIGSSYDHMLFLLNSMDVDVMKRKFVPRADIVSYIHDNRMFSVSEISAHFQISENTTRKKLNRLVKEGLAVKIRNGRSFIYTSVKKGVVVV